MSGYISKKYGVAMIEPPRATRTPRGGHVTMMALNLKDQDCFN